MALNDAFGNLHSALFGSSGGSTKALRDKLKKEAERKASEKRLAEQKKVASKIAGQERNVPGFQEQTSILGSLASQQFPTQTRGSALLPMATPDELTKKKKAMAKTQGGSELFQTQR